MIGEGEPAASDARPRGAWLLDALVVSAAAALFAAVVEALRPLPFASTDDNPIYFGPLIGLHTDALLAGRLPRMFWEMGAGWTPLESGQVALLYPPYVAANLVARALGRPLLLLEVSAWLHLWAAGLVTLLLLPRSRPRRDRIAWAILAIAQPAPFLLGLNWHDYVTPYPWFLAVALLLLSRGQGDAPWRPRDLCLLTAASVGFWWTSHPQMYVLGIAAVGAGTAALRPGRVRSGLAALAVAQLPVAASLLYVRDLAQHATGGWMAARSAPYFALGRAQTLSTIVGGLFTGNFLGDSFTTWNGVRPGGQGMLFAPWLAWSWVLAATRRRWVWLATSGVLVAVLALRTFPFLKPLFPAALGFRWTWKLATYLGPLAMITAAALAPPSRSWRTAGAVLGLAVASAAVCARGLEFDLWPALNPYHARGPEALFEEARTLLRDAGIAPGARLAVVAAPTMISTHLSVPMVALTGAAPVLLGLETAHTYEPLEDRAAAAWHGELSLPWRGAVPAARYLADPAATEAWLASIGVTWIATDQPGLLRREGAVEVRDHAGNRTFLRPIAGAPSTFPWDARGPDPRPLERLPGGTLCSVEPSLDPPVVSTPRDVRWRRRDDGRWEGTPVVLFPRWIALAVAGTLAWLAALVAWRRVAAWMGRPGTAVTRAEGSACVTPAGRPEREHQRARGGDEPAFAQERRPVPE